MALSQWERILRRNDERLKLVVQESYVKLADMVIKKSPVDSGRFRNNWFGSLNRPSDKTTGTKSRKGFGESGGARLTEMIHISASFDLGDSLFITNNLPYARALEFGHSQQAPAGIARVSEAQWPLIVASVARGIR